VTDGQTDRQTDRILLGIPRLHYMQRGKNPNIKGVLIITLVQNFVLFYAHGICLVILSTSGASVNVPSPPGKNSHCIHRTITTMFKD